MAFTYSVKENYGTVGSRANDNNIQFRLVSWNNASPKYDLRNWYTDKKTGEERCAKGMTFDKEDLPEVLIILNSGKDGQIQKGEMSLRIYKTQAGNVDIRLFRGNFSTKGITLKTNEAENFRDILARVVTNKPVSKVDTKAPARTTGGKETKEELDSVVRALTQIPVNDSNYPKDATPDQLRKAIAIMESQPNGHHKTRLTRCKSALSRLEKGVNVKAATPEPKEKEKPVVEKTVEPTEIPVAPKSNKIITFPKQDETEITKLPATNETHTYEECEAKLNKEREMFKGDRDSNYVIDGLLEVCVVDQDFRNNVMRPEKSYVGAMNYFADKAKQGYCMRVGNIGVMDADTALQYSIDYFNSEDSKPEPKKGTKKSTTKGKKVSK